MSLIEKLIELKNHSYPLRFETAEGSLIIEIQYLVEQDTEFAHDFIHFAVTTDGWDLLISSDSDSDSIMQRENDDVDLLGITLSDLLNAKRVSLQ
ncbi:hypothetical protein [Marinobacter fuscus]|uniref:hypothetical protein n=1 Tax=Marinobacter fuscus TaxID=2109942 RepID=UPI0010570536|nr:hypothetical protein [Marinobacter fuscus]